MSEPDVHRLMGTSVRRRQALVGLGAAGLTVLAACTSKSGKKAGASGGSSSGGSAPRTKPQPQADVVFAVADQAVDVGPVPVVVKATGGTLSSVVTKAADGTVVNGALDPTGAQWTSTDQLAYAAAYTVSATAAGTNQVPTTKTVGFTTVTPGAEAFPAIGPLAGTTVGVGMPVRVYFDQPVTDHKTAQAALGLQVTPDQPGSWSWRSDTEVHWRPQNYWQAGTKVVLTTSLYGVNLGGGVWGKASANRQVAFAVGDSHISKADTQTHQMQVFTNGQLVNTIPIAAGAEVQGRYTHNGAHVVTEKRADMTMDSTTYGLALDAGGYTAEVKWATRISNNGEFVHAAPWSVADQGRRNVSHGCLNASPDNAKWFFDYSVPGDVVEVSGSPVPLTEADGDIYDWTIDWATWTSTSAP